MLLSVMLCFAFAQEGGHPKIDPARVHGYESEEVTVADFAARGWILDIGGGGEGVIGRMKGGQVVAIDLSERELREAPAGPLKVVMNATELKFLAGSFSTATSFFTLMYMKPEDREKTFGEVYRVLAPGGVFHVWDVALPVSPEPGRDIAVFRFRFRLPKEEVNTGYGTFFPKSPVGVDWYIGAAERAGFRVGGRKEQGRTFYLELEKR